MKRLVVHGEDVVGRHKQKIPQKARPKVKTPQNMPLQAVWLEDRSSDTKLALENLAKFHSMTWITEDSFWAVPGARSDAEALPIIEEWLLKNDEGYRQSTPQQQQDMLPIPGGYLEQMDTLVKEFQS
jgi:hypothetical protein